MRTAVGAGAGLAALYVGGIIYYGFSPYAHDVGYQPIQPIGYSHALHAGKLGMDCRYCHSTVETDGFAAVPATGTCMGCHTNIKRDGEPRAKQKIADLTATYASGEPMKWIKVHDLPDYAYFNHSAHVNRGVGCSTCHGRIDKMEIVHQVAPLSMGWCLECHRNPERYLRPLDRITDMTWAPSAEEQLRIGTEVMKANHIQPSQDCSTCHR